MLIFSSFPTSFEDRLLLFSSLSRGSGGGEEDVPGGVTERRDFLELREGVRYGVLLGVGNDAAAALFISSSVSHTAMFASIHK